MAAIPIQFGLFIFLSMATLVIYSIAARRKKIPGRFIGRGITLIVSLVLVLVVVGSISALEPMFHSITGAEGGAEVIQEISKNPLGGSKTISVAEYGTVEMKWGLGVGAILMLLVPGSGFALSQYEDR
jgi:energy-coupling factor transporter transmembrane protein EcfT